VENLPSFFIIHFSFPASIQHSPFNIFHLTFNISNGAISGYPFQAPWSFAWALSLRLLPLVASSPKRPNAKSLRGLSTSIPGAAPAFTF